MFEEDDEDDDGMETKSEISIPLPEKKTKRSPAITNISLEKEVGTSNSPSCPLDPSRWTCGVEKGANNVMKGATLPPKDRVTIVDVETLENNVDFLEFYKDSNDSPIDMLHTSKNGMVEIYKVIKWVYSEIKSLKSK